MLTRDEATTRVTRGAAHLDIVRPGWFNEINIGTLRMSSCSRCILGQLYGRYANELLPDVLMLRAQGFNTRGEYFGFGDGNRGDGEIYALLQDAWIAAIADRVLAAAQAIEAAREANAVDPSADVLERVATRGAHS